MADVKISQLPAATTPLAGTELVPIVQGGVTKQVAVDAVGDTVLDEFAASSGSSLVGFLQSGTGAVATTVQAKLRESVSVKDFGAVGDGVTNDTTAIQTAINTGYSLIFPAGTYLASGLTQSTSGQVFTASGTVVIKKNANGVILTSTGNNVELNGISFYGDAASPVYTGDNLNFSGNNVRLINCGSRWAYAKAVKATGNHVEIIGTCDIYQTTDASATGYDIEIGVSGTATLYHQLYAIYTSQATGGIKLIDTGSAVICGGQIGKLYIAKGTAPSGVNGGMTIGCRVIGITTVEASSAQFSGNQFGDNITVAAATSGFGFDGSNILASGKTITDNGIQSLIINGKYNDGLYTISGQNFAYPNNTSLRFRNSSNAAGAGSAAELIMSATDNLNIYNFVSAKTIQIEQAGAGDVRIAVNGVGGLLVSGANTKIAYGTATPAGGTAGVGLAFGTSTNFGVYFGSGAPTLSAAKGSLYLRSDGTTTNDRMYVNTNGSTTWTAVTTVA